MSKATEIAARDLLVLQANPRTGNWLSDTKDILIRFLQEYFSLQTPGEGMFHFSRGSIGGDLGPTDEENTEVIITDAGSVGTETVEKRPAIILSRGPFAYANTSLDNFLSQSDTSDKRTHTDLLLGSFVINCVSRNGLEAERLALLVGKAIRIHRRRIQLAGFFQIGQRIRIGSETAANQLVSGDSDEDFISVPVTFPVYYQETFSVETTATALAKITATIYSVAKKFDGSLLLPDSYNSDGTINPSSDGVVVSSWTVASS
tara:strand:- start:553 stop:1335 length:783 start_codon:yes stop_codon:yes gene_type:complete